MNAVTYWIKPTQLQDGMISQTPRDLIPGNGLVKLALSWPVAPDFDVLAQSLRTALNHVPIVQGRLKKHSGAYVIDCGAHGVPFSKIHWPQKSVVKLHQWFHPSLHLGLNWTKLPLAVFRLNYFSDGSAALAISMSHGIADAESIALFLNVWCAVIDATPLPSLNFVRVMKNHSISPTTGIASGFANIGWWQATKFIYQLAKIPLETVIIFLPADRTQKMLDESGQKSFFVAVAAYLWGHIAPLHHDAGKISDLGIIYSLRSRLETTNPYRPVRRDYFGNAATHVLGGARCSQLAQMTSQERAALVVSILDKITPEYLAAQEAMLWHQWPHQSFSTLWPDVILGCLTKVLLINQWTQLSLDKLQFGTGVAPTIDVPHIPLPWHALLLPSNHNKCQIQLSIPQQMVSAIIHSFKTDNILARRRL